MRMPTRAQPTILWLTSIVLVSLSAHAPDARAQPVPLGDEFVVNTYTSGAQNSASVARDGDGNFIVVWSTELSDGAVTTGSAVRGQRYDAAGTRVGSEFEASALSSAQPAAPDVAMAADGGFMVAWLESEPRIAARAFDDQGVPAGTDFRVDSTIFTYSYGYDQGYSDEKGSPAIAAGNDGRFMIVWSGGYNLYQYHLHRARDVRGQVVDRLGAFVGGEFTVGGSLYYDAGSVDVVGNEFGQFVVVWNELVSYDYPEPCCYYRDPNFSVRARRMNASGAATSDRLTVAAGPAAPSVAITPSGPFIVAWAAGETGAGFDVRAQRYDGSAAPAGDAVDVSTPAAEGELSDAGSGGSAVAANSTGHFAVAWTVGASTGGGDGYDSIGDGDGSGILARVYAPDGTSQGPEIVVNAYTTGGQRGPAIVFTSDDELLVSWTSDDRDGSGSGVVARRFSRAPGCGDASADGANTATDALLALTAAVGTGNCSLCVCDADASGQISATDALLILNDAVGNAVTLACTAC